MKKLRLFRYLGILGMPTWVRGITAIVENIILRNLTVRSKESCPPELSLLHVCADILYLYGIGIGRNPHSFFLSMYVCS